MEEFDEERYLLNLLLSGILLIVMYITYSAYQSSKNWIFTITVFAISLVYSIKIVELNVKILEMIWIRFRYKIRHREVVNAWLKLA